MISITDSDLEHTLKALLLKYAEFSIQNNVWKTGKIVLFKQKGFFIEFYLQTGKDNKISRIEIPIPFDYRFKKDILTFSYEIDKISNITEIRDEIRKMAFDCKSKYYDNCLDIKIL